MLSEAKHLSRPAQRCFASLSMTALNLSVAEELSRSFEPCLNLKGRVVIIELPGGKVAQARIYNGPAIIGANPDQIPITATFQDLNGDGKVDMLVSVGNQQFTYLNDGTQFTPQQ